MLASVGWLRHGRSGLQANASCLHGHCGDAALTRFVYCLARSRKLLACASSVVIVCLNPRAVTFGGVLIWRAHNLFANSLRNVSILTVAMRTQPAKINLLDAYWSHNIPVCDIFCVYSKPPAAEPCFITESTEFFSSLRVPSVLTLTGLSAAAAPSFLPRSLSAVKHNTDLLWNFWCIWSSHPRHGAPLHSYFYLCGTLKNKSQLCPQKKKLFHNHCFLFWRRVKTVP